MKFFVFLVFLLFVGCQNTPKNPEREAEKQINACLPNAIIMVQALRRYDIWAKVITVSWTEKGKIRGHAYAIYLYPLGSYQLWAYDSDWGSTRVKTVKERVFDVAIEANAARNMYGPLQTARYID
jgi:hypothetical protein